MTAKVGRRPLASGLALGISIAIVGTSLALPLYPWTDFVVLMIAFTGGVLLGRTLRPGPFPLIAILVAISVLDVVGNILTSGVQPPGGNSSSSPLLYGNLLVPPPVGRFNIGIGDILLGTAVAESWRLRRGSLALAEVPGLVGFAFAGLFEVLTSYHDLPLIPFLTAGWLISEGVGRRMKGRTRLLRN